MAKDTAYQIQKSAIGLFKEKGYANVTIENICQAANITKSTFYYHYTSKDQLIREFYKFTDPMSSDVLSFLATSDNCWDKLWACLEPSIDWTISAGAAIISQVFISNIQNHYNSFALPNDSVLANLYIEIIKKGQENAQFGNMSDPKLVFNNIKNIITGIAIHWCTSEGSYDEKAAIRESIIALLMVQPDLL